MPIMTRYFLGIDPGTKGGAALIESRGNRPPEVIKYLLFEEATELDIASWLIGLHRLYLLHAVLEQVQYIPTDGGKGSFTFGRGYGFLRGILITDQIRFENPRPQQWQKDLGIPPRKKTETKDQYKDRLREHAQRLYPTFPLWKEPRTLGKQRAVCDAILLAEWLRQREVGK